MKIYTIAFLMIAILGFLFLITPYLQRREQKKNKVEIDFFESLRKFKLDSSEENRIELQENTRKYFKTALDEKKMEDIMARFC